MKLTKPGQTFGMMFILYGVGRFGLEFIRDDNPFGFNSLTISQNISIAMAIAGIIIIMMCEQVKTEK